MINKLQILSLGIDSTYIWKWANSMLCFGDFINPVLMKIVTSNINNPLWGGLIRINPLHEWRVTTRSVTIRSCKSWKKGGGKRGKRGEKGGKRGKKGEGGLATCYLLLLATTRESYTRYSLLLIPFDFQFEIHNSQFTNDNFTSTHVILMIHG